MDLIGNFDEFNIYRLTKDLAKVYIKEIIHALDLIPKVDNHNDLDILSDHKDDRILHAKWNHSIIAVSNNKEFGGIIIGYE